jgi:acyl-CoA thioester hydrolase
MYKTKITPRFGETDALGHINNTVFPCWFEQARKPIFQIFNPEMDFDKLNLIMAHMEFDFLAETYLKDEVEVKTYIDKIGNTSFTILHEAWQNDIKKATGKVVIVYLDYQNKKPLPIPDQYRAKLKEHSKAE